MEARGALLGEESYAPPVYDEVAGTIREGAPTQPTSQPPPRPQMMLQGTSHAPRQTTTRNPLLGRSGASDAYVALNEDEPAPDQRGQRANEIAMKRQQEHAAAFQRQIEAEEAFIKSSQKQVERDAEVAARLAAGQDSMASSHMDARTEQSNRDAALAARLQRELDVENNRRNVQPGRQQQAPQSVKRKVVRVLVPTGARPNDSLAVSTPTTGKFEVKVPAWAPPGSHFDCQVTTIIEVKRPGEATAVSGGLVTTTNNPQQNSQEDVQLPPGWARGVSQDGVPFYIDHNTRTTHWTPPPPPPPPVSSSNTNPPAPPPDVAPAGMTEEEMLAEAIARSLADGAATDQPPPAADPPPVAAPSSAVPVAAPSSSSSDAAPMGQAQEPNLLDLDADPTPSQPGAQPQGPE